MADKSAVFHVGNLKKLKVDIWLAPFRWYITLEVKGSVMGACWPHYNLLASAPMEDDDWQSLIDWLELNDVPVEKMEKKLRVLYETFATLDATLLAGLQTPLALPDANSVHWVEWYKSAGLDSVTAGALYRANISPEQLLTLNADDLQSLRTLGKKRIQDILVVKLRLQLGQ